MSPFRRLLLEAVIGAAIIVLGTWAMLGWSAPPQKPRGVPSVPEAFKPNKLFEGGL